MKQNESPQEGFLETGAKVTKAAATTVARPQQIHQKITEFRKIPAQNQPARTKPRRKDRIMAFSLCLNWQLGCNQRLFERREAA